MQSLTVKELKTMIFESVNLLETKKDYLNYINVFPIRDADTGNNLFVTLNETRKLKKNCGLKKFMHELKSVLLVSARGNSGVIISQFYKGFCDHLITCKIIGPEELATAIQKGYHEAFNSIGDPVEGTMLTVLKGASEGALKVLKKTESVIDILLNSFESAQEYLKKTVNQLPVLKESGVVDAGGLGVVYMLSAWLRALGIVPKYDSSLDELTVKEPRNVNINNNYCVNVLLKNCEHKQELRKLLKDFGDSIQTVDDEELFRVHLHTIDYENVKSVCSAFGEVISFEKEDMREQHEKATSGRSS